MATIGKTLPDRPIFIGPQSMRTGEITNAGKIRTIGENGGAIFGHASGGIVPLRAA
jgi:hypothetical protein